MGGGETVTDYKKNRKTEKYRSSNSSKSDVFFCF